MITNTTIANVDDSIVLARLIDTKFFKIEFSINVKANDLIPYFHMIDEIFMKLVVR